ncbi:hypothetical protein JTB14_016257 [Gonioctena quinquepunctata]|nr:hypothetical protein JTB14_016257 [Gonioctena quinquepunctata]
MGRAQDDWDSDGSDETVYVCDGYCDCVADGEIESVPKLKGRENYSDWSFAVQNMLVLDDLNTCLDGSETSETKDEKAKAKLILTIDPSLFVHVKEATSTKDLWTKLQKLIDDKGFCRKIGLLRALISIRLENCDSMECYVTQLIETAQKLEGTGFQIDDSWIGSLLLAGLPEKYAPMIMAIEHSGIQLTVDSIKTKLPDMEPAGNTGNAFISATRHQGKRHSGNTAGSSNVLGSSESGNVKEAYLKNVKCFRCKQMGHYKNRCPNTNKYTGNKSSNAFSAVFLSTQFSKDDWYVDSGASGHLTVNSDWLTNVSENFELQDIITANNQRNSVSCVGDINIVTVVNRNSHDITITNAMCVPGLTTNLLSVGKLINNGNKVNFEENCCKIYNKHNELVATADLINNIYKLRVKKEHQCMLSSTTSASSEIWHRRLGHINYKDLCKMQAGAVEGMTFKTKRDSTNKCIVCCEGLGGEKTPYEIWNGRKPNIENIRIFSSTAMVHVPKANRTKWQKKSKRTILIGFGENTKGYRVYDPEVGSVSTSRDVVIIEKAEEVPITINPEPVGDNDTTEVIISEDTDTGSESEYSSVRNDEEENQTSDTDFLPEITLRDQTMDETIEAIRRSSRVPKPKSFEDFVTYNCVSGDVDVDPANVDEALSGPEKEQWRQAMKEEYQSFMDNEAWQITEVPDGANVVDYNDEKNRGHYDTIDPHHEVAYDIEEMGRSR